MKEIWKDINGFEGLYQISNLGRVKSIRNNIILKQTYCKSNYLKVKLSKNCKQKTIQVHRLVTETFIPNPDNKPQVNHIDGNKENNHIDNLEWVTAKENTEHAIKIGISNKPITKKVFKLDLQGNVLCKYNSIKEAAEKNKGCYNNIPHACSGRYKTAGGYKWKYAD